MTQHYRQAEVTCRDKVDEPKQSVIALTGETFICASCGLRVPAAGDEIHDVTARRRADP